MKGKRYYTHRLVWSERVAGRMRQRVLNLGAHYPVPKEQWKRLCELVVAEIDQNPQLEFPFDELDLPELDPPELVEEARYLGNRIQAMKRT